MESQGGLKQLFVEKQKVRARAWSRKSDLYSEERWALRRKGRALKKSLPGG